MQTNFDANMLSWKNGVGFIGYEAQVALFGRIRYRVDGQVKAAMNAFGAMVLGTYKYHEIWELPTQEGKPQEYGGLHMKADPKNLPANFEGPIGYVSHGYKGNLFEMPEDAEQGWYPIFDEAWHLTVGRKFESPSSTDDSPMANRARTSIRKMQAMTQLCAGRQVVLLPSFEDADGNFSTAAADHYFEVVKACLELPRDEALKQIRERIEYHRSFVNNGKLGNNPELANALSKDVQGLPVYGMPDVEIPVTELVGHQIRLYRGEQPISPILPAVADLSEALFRVASFKRNRATSVDVIGWSPA